MCLCVSNFTCLREYVGVQMRLWIGVCVCVHVCVYVSVRVFECMYVYIIWSVRTSRDDLNMCL